jgi:hypothetical protein
MPGLIPEAAPVVSDRTPPVGVSVLRSRLEGARGNLRRTWKRLTRLSPRHRRQDAAVRAQRERVADAQAHLGELVPELETRFLTLGATLHEQSTQAQTLVAEAERLLGYVAGRHGGEAELTRGIATLEGPLAYAARAQASWSTLVGVLREHERQVRVVREHQATLQTTIAPLQVIQTLFRVESARLSAEVHGVFVALTADIEQLHKRVTEVFSTQAVALAKAETALSELVERLEREIATRGRELARREEQIRQAVERLRSDMTENQGRDVKLTDLSRAISDQVGRIVIALQFQDITRQKIEHVERALDELATRSAAEDPDVSDCAFVHDLARVQAGHVEAVQHTVMHAETEIRDALTRLSTLTGELMDECTTLGSFKTISASQDGMVEVLLQMIAGMRDVIDSILSLQEEIFRTVEPLGGLASDLTDTMRELSLNIRFIALNAQIQAAHLDAGTGLETLAGNTCAISDETYRLNEIAAAELESLMRGLRTIIDEAGGIRDDGRAEQERMRDDGAVTVASLHAYRDATLGCFLHVTELGEAIGRETCESLEQLGFSEAVRSTTEPLAGALRSLSEHFSPELGQRGNQIEHLRSRYTMQTDRAVHEAALRGSDIGAASKVAAGGEVELFDGPPQTAPADAAALAPVAAAAPAAPPAGTAENKPKPPAGEALGDNVELF